ncbi:YfiR family protein [Pokkaliibacter plantistimulans]|uniref:YfiR family protein n=1 Tax=Pokkaliibacter plantistimulans TaxID=1635171 RepID=UPI000D74D960|nr:YfiR family protein [Pokkaliibacter plantistimulans]
MTHQQGELHSIEGAKATTCHRPVRRFGSLHLLIIVASLAGLLVSSCLADTASRSVKAAYLYNFALFTEWPERIGAPFRLCVLGDSSMDEALHRLEGKPVQQGAQVEIVHTELDQDWSSCRMFFLDSEHQDNLSQALHKLASLPVLTVTDGEEGVPRGFMIGLASRDNRLQFDINLYAARNVGLNFSARLLKLANDVASR